MIKTVVDLSLRLADLVEAEGRVAKAHAVRFLVAGLLLAGAAALAGGSLLLLGAAALLGLVAAGLSWPLALVVVAAGLLAAAVGLGLGGRASLRGSTRTTSRGGAAPSVPAVAGGPAPRGQAA